MPVSQIVLLVALFLFGAYLVFQFRPGMGPDRRRLARSIRDARDRAHAASTDDERSTALAEAGTLAADARRWIAAAGFFTRAMRKSPKSPELVRSTAAALVFRPRVAERIFWRRLGALPEGDEHRAAYAETLGSLAGLYETGLRDPQRARALRRFESLERAQIVPDRPRGTEESHAKIDS